MTVAELIKRLETMPPAAPVMYIWDGAPRSGVDIVWLARGVNPYDDIDYGVPGVMLCDNGGYVYSEWARPLSAPSEKSDSSWQPDVSVMGSSADSDAP